MINTLEKLIEALKNGKVKGGFPAQVILNGIKNDKISPYGASGEAIDCNPIFNVSSILTADSVASHKA